MNETGDGQKARTQGVPPESIGLYRRLIALLGGIVFLLSLGFGLYLTYIAVTADAVAAFSMLVTDMPTEPPRRLKCPALLARHETTSVTATIFNPLDRATAYTVYIHGAIIADDGQHTGPVVLSDPSSTSATITTEISDPWLYGQRTAKRAEVIIPSGETVDLIWRLSPTGDIQAEQMGLQLYALGEGDDRTYSGGFRAWDFSYGGTCGMAIIDLLGLTGRQVSGLPWLGMLLGAIFWLYGRTFLGRTSALAG